MVLEWTMRCARQWVRMQVLDRLWPGGGVSEASVESARPLGHRTPGSPSANPYRRPYTQTDAVSL